MMSHYKDSEVIINKIRQEKKMEVKTDLLDMQMERVRLHTELDMLENAILKVTQKYAIEMNLTATEDDYNYSQMPNMKSDLSKGTTLKSKSRSISYVSKS